MELEYKGHKAELQVRHVMEWFDSFVYSNDYGTEYQIWFTSPLISCRSARLEGPRDIALLKALYTKWWEQAVDKHIEGGDNA